jgi:predicted dehydrogenase
MKRTDRREFLQQMAGSLAAVALTPELLPLPPVLRGAPLPVAVVGAGGRQGRALLTELLKFEAVKVAAVCDVRDERLKQAVRRASGAAAFTDHRKMLDEQKEVAAVVVTTPTHRHREVVLDCLKAGKHVYCEAPLAASLEDLKAIAAAARETKLVFQVGHQLRSNPVYQLARSFLKSGNIRDVVLLRAQWHQKTSWRVPGDDPELNWRLFKKNQCGLPLEVGAGQIDVVTWYLGRFPTKVRGNAALLSWTDGRETPDTVTADLAFPDGVRMHWDATLANSFDGQHELFVGTMGTIKMAETFGWLFKEADAPTQGWEVYASREKFHSEEGITLIADATKLAKQGKLKEGIGLPNPPLYYALQDFVKSVTEGAPVVCGAADGFRAAAIALRLQEAIEKGSELEIGPEQLQGS